MPMSKEAQSCGAGRWLIGSNGPVGEGVGASAMYMGKPEWNNIEPI